MSKPNKKENHNDKEKPEGVFEIMDGLMSQLNSTKKMFLALILTIIVLPAIAMLIIVATLDFPFEGFEGKEFQEERLEPRSGGLLFISRMIIFVAAMAWLVIGIRKWFVISKWSKKYMQFKQRQAEIEQRFDDDEENKNY